MKTGDFMKNKFKYAYVCLSVFVLVYCSGCEIILFGAAAAGTTYSATTGVVTDTVKASSDELVEKFVTIVEEEGGDVLSASISDGKVRARVNNKIIYLDVVSVNEGISKITIKSRKEFELIPDSKEAVRLYKKLSEHL